MGPDRSRRYVRVMDRERRLTLAQRVAPFAEAVDAGSSDGGHTPIDELALLVSFALNPGLDVVASLADLDELAGQCPAHTRAGVMQFLFGGVEPRFRGDTSDYHHWRNSSLDRVVARRRGMPITLAIVAIGVAQRIGVELVGVGMPGHFLIGDPNDHDWFTDPFTGAIGISRDDCRELANVMGHTNWNESVLAPTPTRFVIARVLNNLRATCEQRNDVVRLAIVMQLRSTMPEFASEAAQARHSLAVFN